MKYTREGEIWEAVQWKPTGIPEILRLLKGLSRKGTVENEVLTIEIPGGDLIIPKSCWLLRSGKVLKSETAEDFAANYVAAD
jgi:hypothetical protein